MKIQQLTALSEKGNIFFRITRQEDDLSGHSAETPNVDREYAALLFNVSVDDLDDELDDRGLVYENGGIYWQGVCCCDSLEAMKSYWLNYLGGDTEYQLVVFKGSYIGDCVDGDVASVDEVITQLPVTMLDEVE